MGRVEESSHFTNAAAREREKRGKLASFPGATLVTESELSQIDPLPADHYADEFSVVSDDGSMVSFIDIHHIGNAGLKALFPTVIRLIEFDLPEDKRQIDIFYVDSNGYVFAHTNISVSGKDNKTESKDNSLERLLPYKKEILQRVEMYPLSAMNRIENAFSLQEVSGRP